MKTTQKKEKNHSALSFAQVSRDASPIKEPGGVEKWASGSTSSNADLNGNQNRQYSNLGPSDIITSTKRKPKIKKSKKNGPEKSTKKFYTVSIMH